MFRLAIKLAFRSAGVYRQVSHVHTCRANSTLSKQTDIKHTDIKQTDKQTDTRQTDIKQTDAKQSLKTTREENATLVKGRKKTKGKYEKSYSKFTVLEAEKRLGFRFARLGNRAIPVGRMLADARPGIQGLKQDTLQLVKNKVFDNIVDFIDAEGYPADFDGELKEANVNDLVLLIILPVLTAFRREVGRDLTLHREKEIISTNSRAGGLQEFVVMDFIKEGNHKFVFVIESKKDTVSHAKKQCLLAMKDMGDKNHGGVVYGFVTTGDDWQMVKYNSAVFTFTRRFQPLFPAMETERQEWMREFSIIVDCIHMALRSGGFPTK